MLSQINTIGVDSCSVRSCKSGRTLKSFWSMIGVTTFTWLTIL